MSETLSQDPADNLGSGFSTMSAATAAYVSQTNGGNNTGSLGLHDSLAQNNAALAVAAANLPPFSTFAADMDISVGGATATGFTSDRLFPPETRLLDVSNWDYFSEGLSATTLDGNLSIISTSNPQQYRPWESKPLLLDGTQQFHQAPGFLTTDSTTTFVQSQQQNASKLPSFQSQFQTFQDGTTLNNTDSNLTTLTNLTPVSPNTTTVATFHTLNTASNARSYPLVPAPIQAREMTTISPQFIDDRHIQLYSTQPGTTNLFATHNGGTALLQNNQLIQAPTVLTVIKPEPSNLVELKLAPHQQITTNIQTQQQYIDSNNSIYNGNNIVTISDKKINGTFTNSPSRSDYRKKERRKIAKVLNLENTAPSDNLSLNTTNNISNSLADISSDSSSQVSTVSSSGNFKQPHLMLSSGQNQNNATNDGMEVDGAATNMGNTSEKQVKKKRKRCGECIGCQRKDNCGDCAPCRNDKSHQICKQRRCEKLTDKKLYGEGAYGRGESRRGRGKGRTPGSYRGRKATNSVNIPSTNSQSINESSPQVQTANLNRSNTPIVMIKQEPVATGVQPAMTTMPFYTDPNQFSTTQTVWQTDPTGQVVTGWPAQGQFIHQISHVPQVSNIENYVQQTYTNSPTIYQTTQAYQPQQQQQQQQQQTSTTFETNNTFYTNAPGTTVHVITNQPQQRPSSVPNHQSLTPRPNSNYSSSPSPQNRQYQQQDFQNPTTPNPQNQSQNNSQSISDHSYQPQGQQQSQPQSQGQSQQQSQQVVVMTTNAPVSENDKPGYLPLASDPHQVNNRYPGSSYSQDSARAQDDNNSDTQTRGSDFQTQNNHYYSLDNQTFHQNDQQQSFIILSSVPTQQQQQPQQANLTNNNNINNNNNTNISNNNKLQLNSKIKNMILNKQQQQQAQQQQQQQQAQQQSQQNQEDSESSMGGNHHHNDNTDNFLWHSHHHDHNQPLSFDDREDGTTTAIYSTDHDGGLTSMLLSASSADTGTATDDCNNCFNSNPDPGKFYSHLGNCSVS